MSILTQEQIAQFEQDEYALLSGVVPEETAREGEAAMWATMEMDSKDPETWTEVPEGLEDNLKNDRVQQFGCTDPKILACYGDDLLTALSELTGRDRSSIHSPGGVLIWNTFPCKEEWGHLKPHFDGGTNREKFNVTFPLKESINSILFLSDVEHKGGGTFAWPGTDRMFRDLANSNPEKYNYLWDLNSDMHLLDIGTGIELTPKCGDILFYNGFLVHSGSKNVRSMPRLACRHGWRG